MKIAKIFLLPVLLIAFATALTSCDEDKTIITDTLYTRVQLVNETTHDTIVAGRTNISGSITITDGSDTTTITIGDPGNETPCLAVRNGDTLSMQFIGVGQDIRYTVEYTALGQSITTSYYPYKVEMTVSGMEPGLYGASATGRSQNTSTDPDEERYINRTFEEENILQVTE